MADIARIALAQAPTPLEDWDRLVPGLRVKRDDLTGSGLTGNKVRKLEYLLHGAREHVVTVGAVGSHHVLATAIHAARLGHRVSAVLTPRPWSPHAEEVLAATLGRAELHFVADYTQVRALTDRLAAGGTYIPAGGSNRLGALGWVRAGLELAEQVRAGLLPEPRRVYVPFGTAGTAAGLQEGLRRAGLESRVIGVRVVPDFVTPAARAAELGSAVEVDDRFIGPGYGVATPEALAAVARVPGLETTYTGKALARALADEGGPDLFWSTVSTVPLPTPRGVVVRAEWGWGDVSADS